MKRILIFLISIVILTVGSLAAIKFLRPTSFDSLLITFDLVPESISEKKRLERIALLPISSEKKKILANRTIFMGASTAMVRLALGGAIDNQHFEQTVPATDRWIYYFSDDSRPTILEFSDNKLFSAYKVSAHELKAIQQTAPNITASK